MDEIIKDFTNQEYKEGFVTEVEQEFVPLYDADIIAEYEDVLNRPKFRFDRRTVRVFMDELKRRGARIVDGKMKVVKEIELS